MGFPKGFLFGAANADHQVEAHDPAREDVWDVWERTQGLTPRGQATDFWNRYEEDVANAAGMGMKIFRFSIAWARVEVKAGEFDAVALAHYRKVAECVRGHGMEVMVTLHHFVWPLWLERDHGGMIGEEFPELFARYAAKAAEAMGDLVDWWITFNEPSQLTFGYIKPWWRNRYYMPPGLPRGSSVDAEAEAVGKLVPNLFRAHARARAAIREQREGAKVGVNPLVTGFPIWLQMLMDWGACHRGLSEALFKFTTRKALVRERGEVDLVIGEISPQEALRFETSVPYAEGRADESGSGRVVAAPYGHSRLLERVDKLIVLWRGTGASAEAREKAAPMSLHEVFEKGDSLPDHLSSGRGFRRVKRRGKVRIGLLAGTGVMEKSLARAIAKDLLGDESCLELVELRAMDRLQVLETKSTWLNWAWRFWGTTSLIANANWWYLGISGKLAAELCPEEAIGAQDFVGLDYYWGLPSWRLNRFRLLEEAAHGRFLSAPVWPRGLYHALKRFHRWFPDQDVLIVENGCVPNADGMSRSDYVRAHLRQVENAIAEGVPVKSYTYWSITSNREWGHAFDPNTDFGLYFVDLDKDQALSRVPTPEVGLFRKLVEEAE
ncbi:family 1 glycosylhydrolase [Haloferula chungangensis]|uniref:Family 1 glycosylhydrolase n=1 Tax=Haloferula chungangensis TaxID=1048331 RepID=A0ABW2L7C7_9BACT